VCTSEPSIAVSRGLFELVMAVDYCSRIRCSEEVVVGVIDDILTEGGHMLWQKYLQRKAFPFAAETATDALVSQLRMCFVAHDRGEPSDEVEVEDWSCEAEPIPAEVDNWARMQLSVRRKQKKYVNDMSPVTRPDRRLQTQRTRVSDARVRAKSGSGRDKQSESRSFDLKEDIQLDDEEEKLRDQRLLEETKRRDRENKVRLNEKAKEVEQQRVQALHEEMSRRLHTFDSEGGLIWVEDLKLDRLPKVQEVVPYYVKKDPRTKGPDDTASKGKDSPAGKKAQTQRGRGKRFDRSSKKMDEDDFPDGFSKLQHGQPPILETMVIKAGVVLDVYGKTKAGPPAAVVAGGGMSRKDYVALSEKEVAYEAQFASMSDPSKDGGGGSPTGGPPGTAGSMARSMDGGLAESSAGVDGTTLPPIPGASGNPRSRGGTAAGGNRPGTSSGAANEEKKNKADVQMAPPAPSMNVRNKKMQAIGHLGQPPRLHVAPLGGPYGYGTAQPPLGATMGHGLVRHGSCKESYFFPHTVPEIPTLLRATSETAVGPKGRGSPRRPSPRSMSRGFSREESRSQTAPSKGFGSIMDMETGATGDEESPRHHGMIRPEKKSQAYRGMRQTLFPNTLSSGYVSGML